MNKLEEKLLARIAELKRVREQANAQLNAINGAIGEMENILKDDNEEEE